MTLIAAYMKDGIPVLIGDIALMKGEVRSLRKKAYIISPNLAIAWAGHFIVAKTIVRELRTTFKNKVATKAAVEKFFTGQNVEDFGSLHTNFIGWVVDGEPLCFRWNCLYPDEVYYDSLLFDGTGDVYFESLRGKSWQEGGSVLTKRDEAILSVLNEVAHARFEESLYRQSWNRSFGASYDILAFERGKFRYVRSLMYIGWDYHWDSHRGTGRLEQAPVVLKHTSMGEYSILQETTMGKHDDGRTFNYLSRPVYDDMPKADLANYPFSLKSDYYANYFLFREDGKTIFKVLLTTQGVNDNNHLMIRRHGSSYVFGFDTKELDRIFVQFSTR